jgi:mannose-6-phosphate isomerase-like protein (cupin superfamily)
MFIPFNDTTKIDTEEGTIWDYLINSEVGLSYQQLNMRGPRSGRYLNKKCHEIYFVISGVATFFVGDDEYSVGAKDIVVVEPGTPHHIETRKLTYVTITRPDWYEEQYEQVA